MRRTLIAVVALCVATLGLGAPAAAAHPQKWPSLNTQFVTRDGAALQVGRETFRFAGTNIYWLGLDENVGGVDYPTEFRIRDAIDTAKAMGLTVVRSHMLASTGNPKSLLPDPSTGDFNEAAFRSVDYAVAYAGSVGVRLILPLTDNWAYYHGGHADFTRPYGLPDAAFYSDPRVIADYQRYVEHVMRRVNPLTGKRYVDDPTILAWELGNELEGMTAEWIRTNAEQFKAWAPKQLIAAGRRFDIDPDTLAVDAVDIVDVHYYPPTAAKVAADAATVTAAGKVYLAGEYASNAASSELLDPLASNPDVTGMLSWSLFGHHDEHGFVQHDDGFTFHYPGDDRRMAAAVQAQIAYARALGAPAWRPRATPLLTTITARGGLNVLAWRGAAAATGYRVERARTPFGPWTPAHRGLLTDNQAPWTDAGTRGNAWYRVVTADGRRSPARFVKATPVSSVPGPVTLLTPAAGATGVVGPESYSWSAAAEAGLYTLTVSRNADLSAPVLAVAGLTGTSHAPAAPLDPGVTYHWQVTALNAKGTTRSAVGTFTTRALPTAPVVLDDFAGYPDSAALTAAYVRNPGGGAVTLTLDGAAMRLDADPTGPGYAGVTRTFPAMDLWGQQGLRLSLQRVSGSTSLTVQFVAGGAYWEHTLPDDAEGTVTIPFSAFRQPPWAPSGPLDLAEVTQLSFYTGGSQAVRLVVDDVSAYPYS